MNKSIKYIIRILVVVIYSIILVNIFRSCHKIFSGRDKDTNIDPAGYVATAELETLRAKIKDMERHEQVWKEERARVMAAVAGSPDPASPSLLNAPVKEPQVLGRFAGLDQVTYGASVFFRVPDPVWRDLTNFIASDPNNKDKWGVRTNITLTVTE